MARAFEQAVDDALLEGLRASHGVEPGGVTTEVDVLHTLFTVALPAVIDQLSPHGLDKSVEVAGVYCHQRPYVRWPPAGRKMGRCELGDLLVFGYHRPSQVRQAVLLQMKVKGRGGASSDQKELYENWPRFRYDSTPKYERQLPSSHPGHEGGRYGWVRLCDWCANPAGRVPPDPGHATEDIAIERVEVASSLGAGQLISDFVLGRLSGSPVADYASCQRTYGWDRVVWDLFERSVHATYSYGRGSRDIAGQPRVRANTLVDPAGAPAGVAVSSGQPRLDWAPPDLRHHLEQLLSAHDPRDETERRYERGAGDDGPDWTPPRHEDEPPDGGVPFLVIESDVIEQ